jgi:hypothetical protein
MAYGAYNVSITTHPTSQCDHPRCAQHLFINGIDPDAEYGGADASTSKEEVGVRCKCDKLK